VVQRHRLSHAVGQRAQRRADDLRRPVRHRAIAIMGVLMYAVCALVEKRMTRCAFRGEIVS
jgi:hypothetical protein